MLDYMLFDLKKWFNVNVRDSEITYHRRKYCAKPESFDIPGLTQYLEIINYDTGQAANNVFNPDGGVNEGTVGRTDEFGYSNLECLATIIDKDVTFYVFKNPDMPTRIDMVESSHVKNVIWGGKHPLAHIWQALRAFTARKAVSAL